MPRFLVVDRGPGEQPWPCTRSKNRAKGSDPSGNPVVCIYAKKSPEYLVYRDPERVMVHFADNERMARRQRSTIAALSPLRGQISGLIDGWHKSKNPTQRDRATRYNRRVADAIIMGLEGGVPDALALLTEIRNDIIAERRSMAQTDYLLVAAVAGVVVLVVIWLLSLPFVLSLHAKPESLAAIWTGAAGGVLGAFFSIAIGLRSRSILIDLQKWDNRRDAILRIAVGTIGGAILICLFLTGMFTLGKVNFDSADSSVLITALMFGFLAGFSERAVPDLLAKTNIASGEFARSDTAMTQAVAAAAVSNAKGTTGTSSVLVAFDVDDDEALAPSVEEGVDDCLCDAPPVAGEELTEDKDLPVSVGGVSPDVPAPAEPSGGQGAQKASNPPPADNAPDVADPNQKRKK